MRLPAFGILAIVAAIFMGCTSKVDSGKMVATTAKLYYDYLLEGKYEDFVEGVDMVLEGHDSYRSQLIDNAKMYVWQQEKYHKGIKGFEAVDAKVDEDGLSGNAFLSVNYADSTSEVIVVPMVSREGVWKMR